MTNQPTQHEESSLGEKPKKREGHDFFVPVHEGECEECGQPIRRSQSVTKLKDGRWVHGYCQEKQASDPGAKVVGAELVCTTCFMTKPCECEEFSFHKKTW